MCSRLVPPPPNLFPALNQKVCISRRCILSILFNTTLWVVAVKLLKRVSFANRISDFSNKKLAIIGDKGINEVVPSNFWDSTRDCMIADFKKEAFTNGIIAAVNEAGKQLGKFFPLLEGDQNELSNEISTQE